MKEAVQPFPKPVSYIKKISSPIMAIVKIKSVITVTVT